jgi:hypothetical protein
MIACANNNNLNSTSNECWRNLSSQEKDTIRNHIRNIPNALYKIYYDVISVMDKPEIITFTDKELNVLAKYGYNPKYIKYWPKVLANSNFKIERLKFACYCESHLKFM